MNLGKKKIIGYRESETEKERKMNWRRGGGKVWVVKIKRKITWKEKKQD